MTTIANLTSRPRASRFRALIATISLAMCKLHQIQFEAPWNPRRQGC